MTSQGISFRQTKIVPLYPVLSHQQNRQIIPDINLIPGKSEFIQQVNAQIELHIGEENFGIPQLCRCLCTSRTRLHEVLKKFTGLSASLYIREIRLKRARTLLLTTDLNITQVAFEVGFSDPRYFSRVFTGAYGLSPRTFRSRQVADHF